ncbi:MAG: ATP-binding protein, partial [Actinomycetota bacterium]
LKLKADPDNYKIFMDFVQSQIDGSCANNYIVSDIMIVSEEVVVNIIDYAYPDKKGDLEVIFEKTDDLIRIIFKDEGAPFDPLKKPEPDINKPIEERDIGGFGILLVKKLMDEVTYEYKENNNVLTVIKRIT